MTRRKRGDGKGARAMKSLDLESFWGWLPTFRVVAERESLQEASRLLNLSASSISRTIRLLEAELGRPLFSREGGRLQRNPAGQVLLDSVRQAMRLVDDGAESIRGHDARGPVRMSLPRALLRLLGLPTVVRARAAHPNTCFYLSHDADARAVASGIVDVAIVCSAPPRDDGVEVHRVGKLDVAVYCGLAHPLWESGRLSLENVTAHPFISEVDGTLDVGCWPRERSRTIGIELADPSLALDSCIASLGLALLPVATARDAVTAGQLRALRGFHLPALPVLALRRPRLVDDRAQTVIDDVTACLLALEG